MTGEMETLKSEVKEAEQKTGLFKAGLRGSFLKHYVFIFSAFNFYFCNSWLKILCVHFMLAYLEINILVNLKLLVVWPYDFTPK